MDELAGVRLELLRPVPAVGSSRRSVVSEGRDGSGSSESGISLSFRTCSTIRSICSPQRPRLPASIRRRASRATRWMPSGDRKTSSASPRMALIVTSSPRRKTIPGTKKLEKIVRAFARRQPGNPVYLVGGAVRDRLLGLPVSDFDFAVARGEADLARGSSRGPASDGRFEFLRSRRPFPSGVSRGAA